MKIKYLHKLVTFLVLMAVTTYTIVVKTIRRVRPHLYWESLARQNPALYLSLYFIAVIGFGLGFMCLPEGDFYSPYEKLEPISVFKNIHLSKLLSLHVNENRDLYEADHGHSMPTDKIKIRVGDVTEKEITLYLFLAGGLDHQKLFMSRESTENHENSEQNCHEVRFDDSFADNYFYPQLLKSALFGRGDKYCPYNYKIIMTKQEDEEVLHYIQAYEGHSSWKDGLNYVIRMLYFSATNITTVGIGDVVPLSTEARILTGLEPVIGWMLSGLVISAIGWRVARLRDRPPPRS